MAYTWGMEEKEEQENNIIQESESSRKSSAIQYSEELKDDLHLTLSNLREKSLTTSSMKAKWVGYLAKEKEALQKLISVRADYQKTLMAKNGAGKNAFDKLKNANQDDEILRKIDKTRKDIELSLEVIAQAITALTEFGYNIKNAIEVIKLNN